MKKGIKIIIGIITMIITLNFFFGGGLEEQTKNELHKIEIQVANDAIIQYGIAKRNGSAMDAYIQAGLVSASFLQAKDEKNYKKWKEIESQEAKNVGL